MVSICEIYDRAISGPYVEENVFDLKILKPRVVQLVKEYDIRFDPKQIVPKDSTLIKDVAEAALNLLCDVGVYCTDNGHIIKLSENEVKMALKCLRGRYGLGLPPDDVEVTLRIVGDRRPPLIFGGPCGGPLSEEYCTKILYSYAKEPLVKMIHTGTIGVMEGRAVNLGTPIEMLACRNEWHGLGRL